LEKALAKIEAFVWLEKRYKRKKFKILFAICGVLIYTILVLFNWWDIGAIMTDLLTFIYPAYRSMKAIDTYEKEDDKQWLSYWYD
jgi:receptor expression-enhancing protein 5/6